LTTFLLRTDQQTALRVLRALCERREGLLNSYIPRFIDAAFNAATRDPKPLGAVLRQPSTSQVLARRTWTGSGNNRWRAHPSACEHRDLTTESSPRGKPARVSISARFRETTMAHLHIAAAGNVEAPAYAIRSWQSCRNERIAETTAKRLSGIRQMGRADAAYSQSRRSPNTNTTSDALSTAMSSLTATSKRQPDSKR
jgi:hypothetical protein